MLEAHDVINVNLKSTKLKRAHTLNPLSSGYIDNSYKMKNISDNLLHHLLRTDRLQKNDMSISKRPKLEKLMQHIKSPKVVKNLNNLNKVKVT